MVNGQTVEGVQNFVDLGSTINSADGSRSEQLRRIGKAAGNMNRLECIWRQPHLLADGKLGLYIHDSHRANAALYVRDMDLDQGGLVPPASIPHVLSETYPRCALVP